MAAFVIRLQRIAHRHWSGCIKAQVVDVFHDRLAHHREPRQSRNSGALPATTDAARSQYGLRVSQSFSVVDGQIGEADSLTGVLAGGRVLAAGRVGKLY
jgi:hypothetical protein